MGECGVRFHELAVPAGGGGEGRVVRQDGAAVGGAVHVQQAEEAALGGGRARLLHRLDRADAFRSGGCARRRG
jgi:hypothetical protein